MKQYFSSLQQSMIKYMTLFVYSCIFSWKHINIEYNIQYYCMLWIMKSIFQLIYNVTKMFLQFKLHIVRIKVYIQKKNYIILCDDLSKNYLTCRV